jgi:hypothetical protein
MQSLCCSTFQSLCILFVQIQGLNFTELNVILTLKDIKNNGMFSVSSNPRTIQEWDFSPIGMHWSTYGDNKFLGLKKSWDLIRVDFSGVFLYFLIQGYFEYKRSIQKGFKCDKIDKTN